MRTRGDTGWLAADPHRGAGDRRGQRGRGGAAARWRRAATAGWTVVAFTAALIHRPGVAAAATDAQAAQLFQSGRFREAAVTFEELRVGNPNPAYGCNLGLCYAKLGDAAAAVTEVQTCLDGAVLGVVTRADYQELLSRLRARLATGTPSRSPGGAGDPIAGSVRLVDVPPDGGLAAGASGVAGASALVPPVAIPVVPPVPTSDGVARSLPLSAPTAAAPVPAPAQPPALTWSPPVYQDLATTRTADERDVRVEARRSGLPAAAYVTGVVGVLGVGIGAGFVFHRRALDQEIAAIEEASTRALVPFDAAPALTELRDDRDTASRAATISFVVGGVGLFAALIAAVASDPEPRSRGRSMSFVLGPQSAGVAGRF